ncbi:MAG: DMT family transporter [Clostridia bacterium]|nr:DMT family transporter [Clostridia bacterium]
MGYLYLTMVAFLFSFGGTCVKLTKPFFAPSMITFLRFFVGVFWLLGLKAITRKHFRADFIRSVKAHWKWLIFGAVAKFLHYAFENIGLSIGVSYGNILTQPVQMVLLTILGVTVLHEKMNLTKLTGVILCVAGILLISWNGLPLETFLSGDIKLTALYVVAGIFAGLFVFAQKQIANDFDTLDSNLFMFIISSVLAFLIPLGEGKLIPAAVPNLPCIIAILFLGFVTGIGFYLNAKAIPLVPFQMVALLQSTMVFFALAWGIFIFHESVSIWIISGTIMFVAGIVIMQHKPHAAKAGS